MGNWRYDGGFVPRVSHWNETMSIFNLLHERAQTIPRSPAISRSAQPRGIGRRRPTLLGGRPAGSLRFSGSNPRSEGHHHILVEAAGAQRKRHRLARLFAVDRRIHRDLVVTGRELDRVRHAAPFAM